MGLTWSRTESSGLKRTCSVQHLLDLCWYLAARIEEQKGGEKGTVSLSWRSEDDETPARELRADADATKGPTRALYMFSICLAGAVDLIHSRQLSRPSVHNCACVYTGVLSGVGCMRKLGPERAKWRKHTNIPTKPLRPLVTAADMIEERGRKTAVYRELREREGDMPARPLCQRRKRFV